MFAYVLEVCVHIRVCCRGVWACVCVVRVCVCACVCMLCGVHVCMLWECVCTCVYVGGVACVYMLWGVVCVYVVGVCVHVCDWRENSTDHSEAKVRCSWLCWGWRKVCAKMEHRPWVNARTSRKAG